MDNLDMLNMEVDCIWSILIGLITAVIGLVWVVCSIERRIDK